MKVLIATGIYPPDIGGPATYVHALAGQLRARGMDVTVLTFGEVQPNVEQPWPVIVLSKKGGPILRWFRFAKALASLGATVDIVYATSSISVGVPLLLSRLKGPKTILRLGGDFFWERYTDRGGEMTLPEWYQKHTWTRRAMQLLLRRFDYIVFSTQYQQLLYERQYSHLPQHCVIENALPEGNGILHQAHTPFKILFFGRFVAFKNIVTLIRAMVQLPECTLTLIGEGPLKQELLTLVSTLQLQQRVFFQESAAGQEKRNALLSHDLLILPSITEISPNSALEARALGLPVLLTEETGLSVSLRQGMVIAQLRRPEHIVRAVMSVREEYDRLAEVLMVPLVQRSYADVADDHLRLFADLI